MDIQTNKDDYCGPYQVNAESMMEELSNIIVFRTKVPELLPISETEYCKVTYTYYIIYKKSPEASSTQCFLTICQMEYSKFLKNFFILSPLIRHIVISWLVITNNITLTISGRYFTEEAGMYQENKLWITTLFPIQIQVKQRSRQKNCLLWLFYLTKIK